MLQGVSSANMSRGNVWHRKLEPDEFDSRRPGCHEHAQIVGSDHIPVSCMPGRRYSLARRDPIEASRLLSSLYGHNSSQFRHAGCGHMLGTWTFSWLPDWQWKYCACFGVCKPMLTFQFVYHRSRILPSSIGAQSTQSYHQLDSIFSQHWHSWVRLSSQAFCSLSLRDSIKQANWWRTKSFVSFQS